MKIAISVPDPVFREAETVSRRLRIPRSQFYSRAVEAYVKQHSGEDITARLNEVCARVGPKPDGGWENAALEVLRREKW